MDLQKTVDDILSGGSNEAPFVRSSGNPVHVLYGGAHLFNRNTPEKLGLIANRSLEQYAPDLISFSEAFWLPGCDSFPYADRERDSLIEAFEAEPVSAAEKYPESVLCHRVYSRVKKKVSDFPIEDIRIDFEDGYGIRGDDEEDEHAAFAAKELSSFLGADPAGDLYQRPMFGFRVKSLQRETRRRSVRTLEIFFANLVESHGAIPTGLRVTLPKIISALEVEAFCAALEKVELSTGSDAGTIRIELMIETPEALRCLEDLASAASGRNVSAHFGAYDFTSALGIAANHQHLRHSFCDFARFRMASAFAPLGIEMYDSVTTEIPVPVHKGANQTSLERRENSRAVVNAWRKHLKNVTLALSDGFYQGWDLHPAQVIARYAAVYSFFLEARSEQAARLRGFVEKATKATLTGTMFDDAASAQGILNFFVRGIDCGAFEAGEAAAECGMTISEMRTGSFVEMMGNRVKRGGRD